MAYKDKTVRSQKANAYNAQNYERLNVLVRPGMREEIKKAAASQGESLNEMVNRLIVAEFARLGVDEAQLNARAAANAATAKKEAEASIQVNTDRLFGEG